MREFFAPAFSRGSIPTGKAPKLPSGAWLDSFSGKCLQHRDDLEAGDEVTCHKADKGYTHKHRALTFPRKEIGTAGDVRQPASSTRR
jgi:hypothetical protein